ERYIRAQPLTHAVWRRGGGEGQPCRAAQHEQASPCVEARPSEQALPCLVVSDDFKLCAPRTTGSRCCQAVLQHGVGTPEPPCCWYHAQPGDPHAAASQPHHAHTNQPFALRRDDRHAEVNVVDPDVLTQVLKCHGHRDEVVRPRIVVDLDELLQRKLARGDQFHSAPLCFPLNCSQPGAERQCGYLALC